jgi:hypothetical protein
VVILAQGSIHIKRVHAETAHSTVWKKYSSDPAWANALAKAWCRVNDGAVVVWDAAELRAWSDHDQGRRYTASLRGGCDCVAGAKGLICWHMAAVWILTTAGELAQAQHN